MTLMRDGSLSPGTKCTHYSHCATLSLLPPESHRHRSLRKHTRRQRQVRNDRVTVTHHEESCLCFTVKQAELKTFNFQHIGMQKTMVGRALFCCRTVFLKKGRTVTVNGCWVGSWGGLLGIGLLLQELEKERLL